MTNYYRHPLVIKDTKTAVQYLYVTHHTTGIQLAVMVPLFSHTFCLNSLGCFTVNYNIHDTAD